MAMTRHWAANENGFPCSVFLVRPCSSTIGVFENTQLQLGFLIGVIKNTQLNTPIKNPNCNWVFSKTPIVIEYFQKPQL